MRTSEIRQRWLDYFEKHGHHIAPSVPLVSPDPSILFTIAGMVPFIPYFVGTQKAPWPRAASVQKCIRTNDIDEVGHTSRHGTFFQMCGNFSFGDYFKQGAITHGITLLTTPQDEGGYGLEKDRLWFTIWEHDDESEGILTSLGVDPSRIQTLPREEIFWDTGQPGPAGPCCEIHYDRGPGFGPEGGPLADTRGDRFLEIWNLVFDQYLRGEGTGKDYPLLGELEHKSIDTGLGLERLAYLLQGKNSMYEIDEVYPVIERAAEMAGTRYGAREEDDVRLRIVGDHVRSALMLIADGVRPGNDGRGYVLRRLIRRAVRSMRLLGISTAVLPELLPVSMDVMKLSYPELEADFPRISEIAYAEEQAFRRTLAAGTTLLEGAIDQARDSGAEVSGADAFALHDTYGFPIDLTLEIAAEQGVRVDADGFRTLMAEQKRRARADALAKKAGHIDTSVFSEMQGRLGGSVDFLGYHETSAEVRVVGILVDGRPVPSATAPAEVEVILDRTPFYAEAGGQLADQGTLRFAGGAIVDVFDTQAPVKGMPVHRGTLTEGELTLDERGVAEIDTLRRRQISQAHTATHMVHKALHEFLGEQATQAGSENAPSRLRFDFQHGAAVPRSVMDDIEGRVNDRLSENLEITDSVMDLAEARRLGAMALFGEKYGERVRVVTIGDGWSRELCAGTHVPLTGNIGRVNLLGESSIGSGVRRIEALVGAGAYAHQAKESALVSQVSQLVGARPEEIPERITQIMARLKAAERELAQVRTAQLLGSAATVAGAARRVGPLAVVVHDAGEVAGADDLRTLALDVRSRLGAGGVVALFGRSGDRPLLVVATSQEARDRGVRAGALVREAATVLGGGGGGRDDVAQGGGTRPEAIGAAMAAVEAAVGRTVA